MLTINETRFLNTLETLAQIGATPEGGVTRLALSPEDIEGRRWFEAEIKAAGLEFKQDGAGNISALLAASDPTAKTLLVGSHLDTVPNGGRYDGALGTLAALEAVRTIKEAGLTLPVHLEAISFTDEEGTFMGVFGSQALTGALTPDHFVNPRGGPGALETGLAQLGLSQETVLTTQRDPATLAGFVEVHIEQGTRLEENKLDIGVVTGIVGIRSAWLQFGGQAAHAGTMPLEKRRDALWGATDFIQQAKQLVTDRFTPGVMNCGELKVRPGAFNIVPAEATLSLEFRHGTEALLDEMAAVLFELAHTVAATNNLTLTITEASRCTAAPANEAVMQAIEQACTTLNLKHKRMMSLAGHDTQSMAAVTPSGMIFVPSVDGISHNPKELTHPQDLINGANVLLHTLLELAQ